MDELEQSPIVLDWLSLFLLHQSCGLNIKGNVQTRSVDKAAKGVASPLELLELSLNAQIAGVIVSCQAQSRVTKLYSRPPHVVFHCRAASCTKGDWGNGISCEAGLDHKKSCAVQ